MSRLDDLVLEFSKDADVVAFVNKVKGKVQTTQDNYGDYMGFLSGYVKNKNALLVISKALVLAGANKRGVDSAVQILTGGGL